MATLRLSDVLIDVRPHPVRVSLRVEPGELVALALPPPAGTALARVLVGLAPPISGRVFVGERDVTDRPPGDRQIGYVPAGGALLPHLTVQQNIEYGLRHRELVREVRRNWLGLVVERLELVPTLHLRPHLLSDAQRLRAALARAVACLPEALVLDLPGNGGGDRLREIVARAVLPASPGMAVLVCSTAPAVLAEATRTVHAADAG